VIGFEPDASKGLTCDGVPLQDIADQVGTPLYVYSAALFRARYRAIDEAFGGYPHAIHYALKANSSMPLVRIVRELGGSVDANSIWEIELARKAGFEPSQIVFTGVGKSLDELACAVPLGLKATNVESAGELERIERLAQKNGRAARVAIRINPDIDAKSHPHISTGLKINKFGVSVDLARELFQSIASRRWLRLVALHAHVGSQMTSLEPIKSAAAVLRGLIDELRAMGITLEYVDCGGGLGISYDGKPAPSSAEYVAALVDGISHTGLPIVVEPGRAIAGPSGVLLARIVDIKPRDEESDFMVLDAGMTELLRPALYGAYHRIDRLKALPGGTPRTYEIVGPVCESSDVVGRDRHLPAMSVGDVVAIRDAGAYGSAMSSNYNRRPLPPEVLVDQGTWRVIRKRQTIEDMLRLETE
jgi:diaminopimelate decarboxylase